MKYLFFLLVCFSKLYSQETDSLILDNGKTIALSPLNATIKGNIKDVKITKIQFVGKLNGYGKPNDIRIAGFADYLLKNGKGKINKIKCSYYVEQDKKLHYIRSYRIFSKAEDHNVMIKGVLYEVMTEKEVYNFIIITGTEPLFVPAGSGAANPAQNKNKCFKK